MEVDEVELDWPVCHRLIASRYPSVTLFDQVADPADLEVVWAIESLTNPRLRQQVGDLFLVPAGDRLSGPGSSLIMAAFTHLNPSGSRFSDGSYGVYYAGESLDTAVAEVSHHRAIFLSRTKEPEIDIDLRWIQARIVARLHELRGQRDAMPQVYDPDHYGGSQVFGRQLRERGSSGLVFESVRRQGGQCVAVFRARALSRARDMGHIAMHWTGSRISFWYRKGEPSRL